ncbi:hypothetical protein Egran_04773, partial [Elaphomyces granulatus]
ETSTDAVVCGCSAPGSPYQHTNPPEGQQLNGTSQPPFEGPKEISYHWEPSPAYWDKLSKVWLTKRALREFDRRNHLLVPRPSHAPYRRAVTRNLLANNKVKLFVEKNYPDLSDLTVNPIAPLSSPAMSSNRVSRADIIGPYDDNFKQMLVDGGVYPTYYKYMDPDGPQKPNNLDEVVQRLSQPQPAISSTVSDHDFREYANAIWYAFPILPKKNVLFNNLTSPADSLKEEDLGKAKSDFYYGCQPEQVNANVRKTLSRHIVPSSLTNLRTSS